LFGKPRGGQAIVGRSREGGASNFWHGT
jgi:hypothetical protein